MTSKRFLLLSLCGLGLLFSAILLLRPIRDKVTVVLPENSGGQPDSDPQISPRESITPARQPMPEAGTYPVAVHVVDAITHSPLAAAELKVDEGELNTIPEVAPAGEFPATFVVHRTSEHMLAPFSIEVLAEGYRAHLEKIRPKDLELTIELFPIDAVCGSVHKTGSHEPAEGVLVLAKRRDASGPTAGQAMQIVRGESIEGLDWTRTDEAGRFSLKGVGSHTPVLLRAGGKGLLAKTWIPNNDSQGAEVQLEVSPVFGTLLRVTERDGRPLHLSPALVGVNERFSLPNSFWSDDLSLTPIAGDEVGFVLAAEKEWPRLEYSHEQLLLLVGASNANEVGPNWIQLRVPGYATRREQFFSDRLSADLKWLYIELEPTSESWGAVRITCRSMPEGLADRMGSVGIEGYLILKSPGREDWIPVALPYEGYSEIEGLPSGKYHVHFRNLQGEKQHLVGNLDDEVTIGPSTLSLEFDLGDSGGVEFVPTDSDGVQYSGWFIGDLARNPPKSVEGKTVLSKSQRYAFHKPPYVVPLLEKGTYYMVVLRPRLSLDSNPSIVPIEVVSGATQEVILPWDGQSR